MVRVVIERRVKEGAEIEFSKITAKLRVEAMKQPGFVTSETWVEKDDHLISVVISTWLSADLWEAWATSLERQAITRELEPLLSCPARITVLRHPGEIEVQMAPSEEHLIFSAFDGD